MGLEADFRKSTLSFEIKISLLSLNSNRFNELCHLTALSNSSPISFNNTSSSLMSRPNFSHTESGLVDTRNVAALDSVHPGLDSALKIDNDRPSCY